MSQFEEDLSDLINSHSQENASGTPDFILAEYLMNCLVTYNQALQSRERWYGRSVNGHDLSGGDDNIKTAGGDSVKLTDAELQRLGVMIESGSVRVIKSPPWRCSSCNEYTVDTFKFLTDRVEATCSNCGEVVHP